MSIHASSPVLSGDGDLSSSRSDQAPASSSVTSAPAAGAEDLHQRSSTLPESQGSPQPSSSNRRSAAGRLSRTNTAQNGRDKDGKILSKSSSSTAQPQAGLDPLSTQIYLRTNSNTEPTIAQRLLNQSRSDAAAPDNLQKQTSETPSKPSNGQVDLGRERKKGPSFLSRLGKPWKRDDDMDSDSELGDPRTDGSNAKVPVSVMGAGGGYIPFYKEPPRYIRVKPHNTKGREFNRLFLAQELLGTRRPTEEESRARAPATAVGTKLLKGGDAIWAAEFSLDGRYLAVAGKDQTVRVFAVISTPEERRAHEDEEAAQSSTGGERLSAPVFRTQPIREFEGHTGEVLALSWSKNGFLLSSSMDKTVRLWYMGRNECLASFKHSDLVTSIAFHPTDDRFFLAGSMDAQLRLWSIPDKSVAYAAQTTEFITAVAFSPDGKTAICGLLTGLCMFYDTEGLKPQFQIHVRSSRGKNAKGSKITGIRTMRTPSAAKDGEVKVLISSNDSRVRIYGLKTRMLELKLKGLENQSSQIHARFSDDGRYVVCGSEDRRAYIWKLASQDLDMKDKQPYECFDAHPEVVTTALMAPVKSKQLLSQSGDPIYDLCNPPPVMLVSLDERGASQTGHSDGGQGDRPAPSLKRPEESPAYIERSRHMDGNIVVTTDRTGTIKVFRQDCAWAKRQQNLWESSSKFSGKLAGVGRSGSIITKTSGGSRVHSRRGSLNLGPGPSPSQPMSDRIMSWRQDIDGGRASLGGGTPSRSERSLSPSKANRTTLNSSAANLASEARRQPYISSPSSRADKPTSPASSTYTSRTSGKPGDGTPAMPPTPSFSLISASDSDSKEDKREGEGSFWNLSRWRGGISGLRYVTNSGLLGVGPQSGSPLGGSSETPKPGDSASSRRSMGVGELQRLKAENGANRRRSMAARVPEPLSPGTKRTDSGLGQLSAESTNSEGGSEGSSEAGSEGNKRRQEEAEARRQAAAN